MHRFIAIILLFLILPFAMPGENQEQQSRAVAANVPDPNSLTANWWNYFDVPGTALNERIQPFEDLLKSNVAPLSPSSKEKAQVLLEKISYNFRSLIQVSNQIVPTAPSPAPFSPSYSINNLLDLNRRLRKYAIELKANQDDLSDFLSRLNAAQDYLDRLMQSYAKADNRSEDKLLIGLDIVAYRSAIEVVKRNSANLEKSVEGDKERIASLKDELHAAQNRLVTTPEEITTLTYKMRDAENAWKTAKQILDAKEASLVVSAQAPADEKTETENQYLFQQAIEANIKETLAHSSFILAKVELELAKLIVGENVNISSINETIEQWDQILNLFKKRTQDWTTQSQRQMQRAGQMLSISNESTKSKEMYAIQQRVVRQAQNNLLLLQQLNNDIDDVSFLLDQVHYRLYQVVGVGSRWLWEVGHLIAQSFNQTMDWLNTALFHIGTSSVTSLGILRFLFIMVAAFWVSRLILGALSTIANRRKGIQKSLIYRINRLIHYFILTVGLILALSSLGFDFSSLVIIASALGVGLGFGLQSIFNNFLSGIIILFESQLKVGDFVELGTGIRGEIREINVRTTIITTNDGVDIIVPNAEIIGNKVINWTLKDPYRRVHVPFSVAYGTDKELVSKVVVEAAKQIPKTLVKSGIPGPVVYLTKFGENSLEFELAVWVNEMWTKHTHTTQSDYLWAIDTALANHGINVPFPQREIMVSSIFGKQNLKEFMEELHPK